MGLFLSVDVRKHQFGSASRLKFSEVTHTRYGLRLKVRNLPLAAGAWPKHFPLEITYCKESVSVEQCANEKMLPRAPEAHSHFIWSLQEAHAVPRARCIFHSLNNLQLWHFPACQQPLPKRAWKGRLPYTTYFWKNFLPSTTPKVWVDSTIRKSILSVIQMWPGQITEVFLLQGNQVFLSFTILDILIFLSS